LRENEAKKITARCYLEVTDFTLAMAAP